MTVVRHGFAGALPPEHRERLLGLAHETSFPAEIRIFDEDGEADRFWIIRSGRVALDIHIPGRGPVVVETIGDDELLGWSWMFEPYRWHLGAQTRSPVRAYEFDAKQVRDARDADPAFGLALTDCVAQVVARRLKAARLRLLDLYAVGGTEDGGSRA
ncbi:cyclic nucleotide-binding domain-containing protein [Saccharopolyspora phatthalungensis]|uniref:CRP-like cAMP-binding protein n=1 Tax=Saccharopolyspora phatthalungensis TaxID=664693 RepID=A0A840QFS1_9PSEU|nr:cyclic nucleotide-binding domain-containing protein [Saccharopolyspora phatthalungensis]MBB5155963.1 CRP-like cAMP-binding protein [Saccharopolyspora phatthalungensis]